MVSSWPVRGSILQGICPGQLSCVQYETECRVGVYHRILSAMKNNKILSLAAKWIELEGSTLSEISQEERDRCSVLSLIVEAKEKH